MPLPIVGNPSAPVREPTHPVLDFERLMNVAALLQDALASRGAKALEPALVEELADELGVRESHVYAAATMMSAIPCASDHDIRIELCIGSCQRFGAVELLERLLDTHGRDRVGEGPRFAVVTKTCLNRCAEGPIVLIHTPEGSAGLTLATLERLDEALAEL